MAKDIPSIKRGEQKQQQTHQEYQRRHHQYTLFQLIGFIKFLNPFTKILLIIIWTINVGNCLVLHQRQTQQQQFLQQQNDFISQPEEKGAVFVTDWLKKKLCNNLTTINFNSVESTPAIWPTDFSRNVVVSFWIKSYNGTKQTVACNSMQDVYEDDFYYYIWLYKLLIYMLVASSFEILLLLARNLHNINLTISRCWTSLNMRMQSIFFSHLSCKSYISNALLHFACKATDSRAMSELHHNSNITINFKKGAKRRLKSEIRMITAASTTVKASPRAMETTVSLKPLLKRKGPLSYVFAVLGCHVSPSRSCSSVCCMFPYFKNENSTSFALSYTQVSAMGDFLLLMLFIHVYYQKQQQQFEQSQPATPQRHQSRYYQQVHRSTDKGFSYLGDQKSCPQHCGNMHQKLWMPTYHVCAAPVAIPTTASATDDISIGTRPSAVVQCISQNSKQCSCFCCSGSNFWLQCCNCYCCPCYCCFACSMCTYTATCCTSYSCICCSICGVPCPTYQHFKTCCFIYYCNINHRSCKYCNTCCQNGHLSTRANVPVEIVCVKFSKFGLFNRGNFLAFCTFRGGYSPYVWTLPLRTFGCYEILQATNGLRTYVPLSSNKSCRGGVFLLVYHYNYYQAVMQALCQMLPHLLKLHSCERSIKFHQTLCGIVPVVVATKILMSTNEHGKTYNSNPLRIFMFANSIRLARSNHKKRRHRKSCCRSTLNRLSQLPFCNYKNLSTNRSASPSKFTTSVNRIGLLASLPTSNSMRTIYPCATSPIRTLRRLCGSKYNLTWLLISLVWFEGPKLTNCNVIINYQYQSPPPTNSNNNNPKATVATKPDVEFDYKASNLLNSVHNVNITTLTRTANVYNTGSKNTQQICNNYQTHSRVQRALPFSNINLPTSASKLNVLWREHSFPRSKFEHHAQSDQLRLESIKQQILSKLGLTRKPNVSHPLPKQFIWDTIYRADGINSFSDFTINHHHISQHRMHDLLRVFSVFNTNLRKQQRTSPILKVNKKSLEDFVNKKKSKHDQHHYHPHNNNSNNNDKILKYQHAHTTNMLNYNTTTATITNSTTITNRTTTINPKSIHQLQHERHEGSQHLQYQPKNRLQYIHYRQQQEPPQQTLKHNNKNTINNNMKYKLPKIRHRSSESNNNNRYNDRRTFTYLTDISSDDSLTINYDNNFDKEDVEDNDSTLKYHHYVNEMNADTNSYADEDNEDFFGSTQEIITFAEKGSMYKQHRLVEFSSQNSEMLGQKLFVRNAEIHIRIDRVMPPIKRGKRTGNKHKRLKIWLFQLLERNTTHKVFDSLTRFCGSFEVNTSQLGWQKFDMTATVKGWYTHNQAKKLRLLIDCTGCGKLYTLQLFDTFSSNIDLTQRQQIVNVSANDVFGANWSSLTQAENENINTFHLNSGGNRNLTIVEKSKYSYDTSPFKSNKIVKYHNESGNNENTVYIKSVDIESNKESVNPNRPFLVLHTETKRQRRIRRRAINCNGALHGQCCKESFYVSFKALGWDDWIIAPRGYFANYCRGDCTGPYRTPDTFQTFHAHFIEEYRKMGLLNGMQPCCAPIKFSSMSLIYYGDEGIIKRDLPKMVVDECGCP